MRPLTRRKPIPGASEVMLFHIPHGAYARFAVLRPAFPSRAAVCAYLARQPRPQDYRVSFPWRRKFAYLRGDRFLQRFARKDAA